MAYEKTEKWSLWWYEKKEKPGRECALQLSIKLNVSLDIMTF